MAQYALTDEQVAFYRQNGYLINKDVLTPEELLNIDRVIRNITEEQRHLGDKATKLEWEPELVQGHRVVRRIFRAVDQDEVFHRIAMSDIILDRVESLIGPDIQFISSKVNVKPAYVGSVVEWHQDLAYVPHTNSDLVTCLIYLDDATRENGCLQVVPSQHHGELMSHTRDGLFAGKITEPIPREGLPDPVACEAPAGSMVLMHWMTPHSSVSNHSDRPRRILICDYRAADAYPIYYHKQAALTEQSARQVRGKRSPIARFSFKTLPMPNVEDEYRSLYELQERRRDASVSVQGSLRR
jgi:phytanoyl-CoA hydroxylase